MKKSTLFGILAILIAFFGFDSECEGFKFIIINGFTIILAIAMSLISVHYSDKETVAKRKDKELDNKQ